MLRPNQKQTTARFTPSEYRRAMRHNTGTNDRMRHAGDCCKNRAANHTNNEYRILFNEYSILYSLTLTGQPLFLPARRGAAWRPVATDLPQVAVSLRKQTGDGSDKKRLIVNNQARNVRRQQLCGLPCLQYTVLTVQWVVFAAVSHESPPHRTGRWRTAREPFYRQLHITEPRNESYPRTGSDY